MKDIIWGIFGFLTCFTSTSAIMLSALNYGFTSQNTTSNTVTVASYFQSLFFGFAIASFQEETIFRGFLFHAFKERFRQWRSNLLQALVFSIAHIGYYPLEAWPFFISAFLNGIVFGWLRIKRKTLIASFIAHGLLG